MATLKYKNGNTWEVLDAEDVNALSLSGGTITGQLQIDNPTPNIGSLVITDSDIDRTTTPGSSVYNRALKFVDSNDSCIGFIQTSQSGSSGSTNLMIGLDDASGQYQNQLLLGYKPDGTPNVNVSYPEAWKTTLSIPNAATDVQSISTAAATGTATAYARADHIHDISSATITTALGYTPPTADTNTTYAAATSVQAVATAAVTGTSTAYARADHVHNITKATITTALGLTPIDSSALDNYARLNASNTFSGSGLAQLIQDTVIDTDAANNNVTATKYMTFGMKDKDGDYVNWWQAAATTAGLTQLQIGVRNRGTGSNVNNSLTLQVTNSGTKVVTFSDTAAWQTALSVPDAATTVQAVATAAVTGTSTAYARADHKHNITKATITTALGYTPPTANTWTALAAATTAAAGTAGYAPAPAKLSATTDVKFLSNLATWRTIFPNGSVFLSVTNTSPASYAGGAWTALSTGYTFCTGTGSTTAQSASAMSIFHPYAIGVEFSGSSAYLHLAANNGINHTSGVGGSNVQGTTRTAIAYSWPTSTNTPSVYVYPEMLVDAQVTTGTSTAQFKQYGGWRFPYASHTVAAGNLPRYLVYAWRKTA